MATPKEILLTVGGSTMWDLSINQTGDPLKICFQHAWSLQSVPSITPSPSTYTLEVSNDGVKWDVYQSEAQDVSVEDSLRRDRFNFLYLRVVTNSNGGSGINTFKFVLKDG